MIDVVELYNSFQIMFNAFLNSKPVIPLYNYTSFSLQRSLNEINNNSLDKITIYIKNGFEWIYNNLSIFLLLILYSIIFITIFIFIINQLFKNNKKKILCILHRNNKDKEIVFIIIIKLVSNKIILNYNNVLKNIEKFPKYFNEIYNINNNESYKNFEIDNINIYYSIKNLNLAIKDIKNIFYNNRYDFVIYNSNNYYNDFIELIKDSNNSSFIIFNNEDSKYNYKIKDSYITIKNKLNKKIYLKIFILSNLIYKKNTINTWDLFQVISNYNTNITQNIIYYNKYNKNINHQKIILYYIKFLKYIDEINLW